MIGVAEALHNLACSNHGCVVARRIGMGTSGACHCLDDVQPPEERRRLRKAFATVRALADDPTRADLRAELDAQTCCSSCVVGKRRGGMSTNGGCSCFATPDWRTSRRLRQAFALYWSVINGEPKG